MSNTSTALAVAIALTAGAASAATITNGSFEQGVDPGAYQLIPPGSGDIAGWTVYEGEIGYVGSYWNAASGSRSIDLPGPGDAYIAQTVETEVGRHYAVFFSLALNPSQDTLFEDATAFVSAGDFRIQSYRVAPRPGDTLSNMGWNLYRFDFTARTTSTIIAFESAAPNSPSIALDNVSIASAPEPTTWALLILGFGATGTALRRRGRRLARS